MARRNPISKEAMTTGQRRIWRGMCHEYGDPAIQKKTMTDKKRKRIKNKRNRK